MYEFIFSPIFLYTLLVNIYNHNYFGSKPRGTNINGFIGYKWVV